MSGDEVHTISICPRGFQLAELARGHNITAQVAPCYCPQPKPPARPAAGDTRTDRERVREAVARALYEHDRKPHGAPEWDHELLGDELLGLRTAYRESADAVLALPELAALLDAGEKVRRVEELHRPIDPEGYPAAVDETAFCAGCGYLWPCGTARSLDGDQS